MSNYHCYLCASDDGIQLDIFGVGGKAICEKIESCLSVKIKEDNAIATKICHKCAYELDACSKFVAKYKQSRDGTKGKSNPIKGHCSLCLEPGKKGYIFDCREGNPTNDTLHKIQEIFNDSILNDKRRTLSICLDCRYNLDVLFDLKCIYQSTPDKLRHLSEKRLKLSELPKTKTRVVKRKTTFIPVPRLNGTEADDTDSSSVASIMPFKRKRGRPRKNSEPVSPSIFRTCEQCEINVESGLDMYRYHRTGITVCKECWLAMDPEKLTHNKRKKLGIAGGEVGTRRCAIILKDVLTNPAKYENIYKVEKDKHGNTTFIVTDDSSENEEREKTAPAKKSRRSHGSVAIADETPVKRTRPPKRTASIKSTDLDDEPPAKIRDKGKNTEDDVASAKVKGKLKKIYEEKASTSTNSRTRNGLATSDTEVFESRTRRSFDRQSTDGEKNAKAASDAELTKPPAKKRGTRTRLVAQPADATSNETKTTVTTKVRKIVKSTAPVVSTTETVERPVRRTRAHSLSSQDVTSPSNHHSNASKNAKSASATESPPTKTRSTKTKSLSPENSAEEIEVENPYTCSVCRVEYRNKLLGMKHELTHAKQPEVKLQRVAIPEIIVEEAPAESSLIEEPEEQSHDVSSTSENRPGDSENVETSVPAAFHEKTSINVVAETNETAENFEKCKSSPEVVETTAKVDDKQEKEEDKFENKTHENTDAIEEKADENENKDKDNVDETNHKTDGKTVDTDDKNKEKTEETEETKEDKTEQKDDRNLDQTEETEDKNEDKTAKTEVKKVAQTDETEDKNEQKTEKTGDKSDDKTEERKDETENKIKETDHKIEDKTEAPETTETESTVDNENVDENNLENTRSSKTNDILPIADSDKNNEDLKTGITEVKAADSEKPESTLSEEIGKEEESANPLEKLSEEVLNELVETSENLNGVDVQDDANSEVHKANGVEKDAIAVNSNAESEPVDDHFSEKSIESDNVPPVTSTSPEKNNEIEDVVKDKVSLADDGTTKNLEAEAKANTTEGSIFPDKNAAKSTEVRESVVSDGLTEVFDLATAEVQKRLENEPSRDEKCTTPVAETVENISREISNSADMPSLDPLIDNQSSNIQS